LTAMYNLEILYKRRYFHCKSEICPFIEYHWANICPGRARNTTWYNTVMSQISTHPELFQSNKKGSGYWALKRTETDAQKEKRLAREKLLNTPEKNNPIPSISAETETIPTSRKRKRKSKQKNKDLKWYTSKYIVEEICAKRILQEEVQYFVQWFGCDEEESSWEKESDLLCPKLIQEFEAWSRQPSLWMRKIKPPKPKKPKKGERLTEPQQEIPVKPKIQMLEKWKLIPITQICHQCKKRRPVVVYCHNQTCNLRYCELCLESQYGEELSSITKQNGEWLCPKCKRYCSCEGCKMERGEKDTETGKVQILKIIARCKQPGPNNDWEYLVKLRGRTRSKDCWIKAKDMIGEDLHSKYKNTLRLKMDRSAKKEMEKTLEREKEKERKKRDKELKREKEGKELKIKSPAQRSGSGNWRTSSGRTLRSRDYDISRVIFDDGPHKIVIPEHKTVVTPHWRIIPDSELDDDTEMAIDSIKSGEVGSSTTEMDASASDGTSISSEVGNSITENKINGVEQDGMDINVEGIVDKEETIEIGSENENTSDESYTKRHSKYEHKYEPLTTVGPGQSRVGPGQSRSRQKKKRKSG